MKCFYFVHIKSRSKFSLSINGILNEPIALLMYYKHLNLSILKVIEYTPSTHYFFWTSWFALKIRRFLFDPRKEWWIYAFAKCGESGFYASQIDEFISLLEGIEILYGGHCTRRERLLNRNFIVQFYPCSVCRIVEFPSRLF